MMEVQLSSFYCEVLLRAPVPEFLQIRIILNNDRVVRVLSAAVDDAKISKESE